MSRPSKHLDHGVPTWALDALRDEIVRYRAASGPAGRRAGAAHRSATRTLPPIAPQRTPADARVEPSVPAQGGPPETATPAGQAHEDMLAVIEAAKAGDAEAFGELYDRNVETVYRYVYYRVGSVALAEDLVSETFLRALRRMDSFTYQGRDVAAWFITIARNLIADHFKSSRYRLELSTDDMVSATDDRVLGEDPAAQVLQSMSNHALVSAVHQLGSEQQECIALRFLQGMSVSETALAMGKNEGAIKALQYRAVRALARLLPPDSI